MVLDKQALHERNILMLRRRSRGTNDSKESGYGGVRHDLPPSALIK
jgi:hypothetical protein